MEVVECLWVGADLAYRVVLSVAWIQDKLVKHEGCKDREQSQGNSDFVCFLHQSILCHYLAITCQTPRTTDYLRRKFEEWHELERFWGGYTFENTMKLLENQGFLKYQNGDWEATDKALDYIDKYHGD